MLLLKRTHTRAHTHARMYTHTYTYILADVLPVHSFPAVSFAPLNTLVANSSTAKCFQAAMYHKLSCRQILEFLCMGKNTIGKQRQQVIDRIDHNCIHWERYTSILHQLAWLPHNLGLLHQKDFAF